MTSSCGAPPQLQAVTRKAQATWDLLFRLELVFAVPVLLRSHPCGACFCYSAVFLLLHVFLVVRQETLAVSEGVFESSSRICMVHSVFRLPGTRGSTKLPAPRILETRSTRAWCAWRPPTPPCTCRGAASRCRRADPGPRHRRSIPGNFNRSAQQVTVMLAQHGRRHTLCGGHTMPATPVFGTVPLTDGESLNYRAKISASRWNNVSALFPAPHVTAAHVRAVTVKHACAV